MDYEKPIRFDDDSIFSFINNYDIEDVNDIIRIVQDKKTPSFEKKVFNSLLKNYYRSLEEMNQLIFYLTKRKNMPTINKLEYETKDFFNRYWNLSNEQTHIWSVLWEL